MYRKHSVYKEHRKFRAWERYYWDDRQTLGWVGVWQTMPLLFNGEYGTLVVAHSIPYEKHRFWQEDGVAYTLSERRRSQVLAVDTRLDKPQLEIIARQLAKEDPGMSTSQLMAKIKHLFPNSDLLCKTVIKNAIIYWRDKMMPVLNAAKLSINLDTI